MATILLDDFTKNLITKVENAKNGFSVNEIREFLESYKREHVVDHDVFIRKHYQNCQTRYQQEVFDPASMREPFKRVITSRFVRLFPPKEGLDDSGKYMSRRMLPGFFTALEKMVGGDALKDGHHLCKTLIEEMKISERGFLWEDLYEHPQAQAAVDDLLMAWLPYFDDPMRRIAWLQNMINTGLAAPDNYPFEGPANRTWRIDKKGVTELLCILFGGLKQKLADEAKAQALKNRYGEDKTRALVGLTMKLNVAMR